MELYRISLLSPFWWISVLLGSVLLGSVTPTVAGRLSGFRRASAAKDPVEENLRLRRVLRLRLWAVDLLVLANLGMIVGLSAVNLRTPALCGPVSLAFVLLCLVSLTLASLVYLSSVRCGGSLGRRE